MALKPQASPWRQADRQAMPNRTRDRVRVSAWAGPSAFPCNGSQSLVSSARAMLSGTGEFQASVGNRGLGRGLVRSPCSHALAFPLTEEATVAAWAQASTWRQADRQAMPNRTRDRARVSAWAGPSASLVGKAKLGVVGSGNAFGYSPMDSGEKPGLSGRPPRPRSSPSCVCPVSKPKLRVVGSGDAFGYRGIPSLGGKPGTRARPPSLASFACLGMPCSRRHQSGSMAIGKHLETGRPTSNAE